MANLEIKSKLYNYQVEFINPAISGLYKAYEQKYIFYDSNLENIQSKHMHHIQIAVDTGENLKTMHGVLKYIEKFQEMNIKRGDTIAVVGGATMQDAFGFICSIYMRGIDWIFVPTTLLAMADSCIGGKTSINFGDSKNILGNFYPPKKIIIDTRYLATLPKKEKLSGIGEMMHIFAVAKQYKEMERLKWITIESRDVPVDLIESSLKTKKNIIEQDEFDASQRLYLNYGHTFGHALEASLNYEIPHGICVAFGAIIANEISYELKLMSLYMKNYLFQQFYSVIEAYGAEKFDGFDIELYMSHLQKDKKNKAGRIGCILLHEGEPLLEYIPTEEMKQLLLKLKIFK